MVRFDFKPDDGMLTAHYQRLEKCVNEMNKANNVNTINYWTLEAYKAVCNIREINCNVLDMNGEVYEY